MRNLDTIETLETFVVLARLNSVGKTAEQLHISKASVSRRISSLETSIGKLFIRNQNGSELTPLGCLFLEKIQPLSLDLKGASADQSEFQRPTLSAMVCSFHGSLHSKEEIPNFLLT